MRILLVAPSTPDYQAFQAYTFPLGMAYISSSLKAAGHEVWCINGFHLPGKTDYNSIFQEIARKVEIEIVATGGFSFLYHQIKEVLDCAGKIFPKATTVLGGNIVTCHPAEIVADFQVDYGVMGEGEFVIRELLAALEKNVDPKGIDGLVIRDRETGAISVSPAIGQVPDLDTIPFADLDGFEFGEFLDRHGAVTGMGGFSNIDNPRVYTMLASRSCPYQCTFCYHAPTLRFRQRSVENCFAEIDHVVQRYGVNVISFCDEVIVLNNDIDRLFRICDGMKARDLRWTAILRAESTTAETLDRMVDSGCILLNFGVENMSPIILKSMRKNVTKEELEEKLAIVDQYPIGTLNSLLFFDPAETRETFWENLRWWLRHRHYMIFLTGLFICPNSKLYIDAKKRGLIQNDIEFIKQHVYQWQINVTDMPEEEFVTLRSVLRGFSFAASYFPGLLLQISRKDVDAYNRPRYDIDTVCPHCGGENHYSRLLVEDGLAQNNPFTTDDFTSLYCRQCNKRYDIPNPLIKTQFSTLSNRMFLTNYPPNRLLGLYLERGGTKQELNDYWPQLIMNWDEQIGKGIDLR